VTHLEAALLGIVQGLTEFLPISSSGHLVAFQQFLGIEESQLLFDIVVHLGTMSALILIYGRDLARLISSLAPPRFYPGNREQQKKDLRFVLMLIIASVPTALLGMYMSQISEQLFSSLLVAGIGLIVTGFMLYSTTVQASRKDDLRSGQAFMVGVAQGLAIIPGVSRAGATISTAVFFGVDQMSAARFSFILSIPAIFGAILHEFLTLGANNFIIGFEALTGFTCSLIVGYFALILLFKLIGKGKFHMFAYYCWALGSIFLAIHFF